MNNIEYDSSMMINSFPNVTETVYFIQLLLITDNNKIIDENVYWLANPMDILDWEKSKWDKTPIKSYANFTLLNSLQMVTLESTNVTNIVGNGEYYDTQVTIMNKNENIVAFMINVKIMKGENGEPVLPILWSDNWITIFPNDQRTINATYKISDVDGQTPFVRINVYNNIINT